MLQQLAPKYIETGKVKLVYKNFPVIGPESEWAAQAALCAADEGKFWSYANYLFSHQGAENSSAFAPSKLKDFAAALGLSTADFNTCLDSGKERARVQSDKAEGVQRGVQATPTFFINNQKIEGVLTVDQMSALIDQIVRGTPAGGTGGAAPTAGPHTNAGATPTP